MTTIKTNHRPRPVLFVHDLSPLERSRNDIDADSSDSFFRYRREVYPLSDFVRIVPQGGTSYGFEHHDLSGELKGWDGIMTDSFFSALVVRLSDDCEEVVVGLLFS
jgi:hypothetical protein